jgi:hypothetical protein
MRRNITIAIGRIRFLVGLDVRVEEYRYIDLALKALQESQGGIPRYCKPFV